MNAVNASATARQHAAPNSTVGLIAAYEKALTARRRTSRTKSPTPKSSRPPRLWLRCRSTGVPEEPVKVLNERLGLDIDPESAVFDQIIDEAREITGHTAVTITDVLPHDQRQDASQ